MTIVDVVILIWLWLIIGAMLTFLAFLIDPDEMPESALEIIWTIVSAPGAIALLIIGFPIWAAWTMYKDKNKNGQ